MVIVNCYILCAVFVLQFYDWQYWFVYTSIVTHEQGCVLCGITVAAMPATPLGNRIVSQADLEVLDSSNSLLAQIRYKLLGLRWLVTG